MAAGTAQRHSKEYAQLIGIARGARAELDTQLELALMLDFVRKEHTAYELCDRTGELLTGLHKKWR